MKRVEEEPRGSKSKKNFDGVYEMCTPIFVAKIFFRKVGLKHFGDIRRLSDESNIVFFKR